MNNQRETLVSGLKEQNYWLIKVLYSESCSSKEGETDALNSYLHLPAVRLSASAVTVSALKKRCNCGGCHRSAAESSKRHSWSWKQNKTRHLDQL